MLAEWKSSDVVKLLTSLISSAYEKSPTVLPLIAKEIKAKVVHVANVTELPDRLLVVIFKYLDVDSLQCCQEVCIVEIYQIIGLMLEDSRLNC